MGSSPTLVTTVTGKVLKGAFLLTLGRVLGYGLSFVRNIILARLLTKSDFGLAAVFGMAMTMLEISGRMAFGQQVIQSKMGDSPRFQATAHALQCVGGACSAVLVVAMSVPLAHYFKLPNLWWVFGILAIVPLSLGASHLDVSRSQREMDFRPLVLTELVPQLVITAAAWPLAVWLADYRVILCLLIAKATIGMFMSFQLAERPYQLAWEREYISGMLSFGWPLLLSSLIAFASQQGDQLLVGGMFSLDMLANYSLAASLVSIPWFIFGQVGGSLMLPVLARSQDDHERLCKLYRLCIQAAALAGALSCLPLAIVGEQLVTLIYGSKYQGTGPFVAVLGAGYAVRFLRFAPAAAALAKGDTINQLYTGIWRCANVPLALLVVLLGGTPILVAGCTLVAEALAAVVSIARLSDRQRVPLRESYGACLFLATLTTLGLGLSLSWSAQISLWGAAAAAFAVLVGTIVTAYVSFPDVVALILVATRRQVRT